MSAQRLVAREVALKELAGELSSRIGNGCRLGTLTARRTVDPNDVRLCALLVDPTAGPMELLESPLAGASSYRSLVGKVPQAHWFERCIMDMFGIYPDGHPRLKGLILHEAWPDGFYPLLCPEPQPPGSGP